MMAVTVHSPPLHDPHSMEHAVTGLLVALANVLMQPMATTIIGWT